VGLTNITGVFSRYFVVGFFLPAYISLVALWLTASSALLPEELQGYSETAQLGILGGVALVVALTLSGLSYHVTRISEGYPLERVAGWPAIGLCHSLAIKLQRRRYEKLLAIREDEAKSARERGRAAWCLDRYFPHDPKRLLPTRVGNAIRASEQHSNTRWGLDGVTIWPRVEALMSAQERELLVEAKINFYVFTNAALGASLVGISLVIDKAVNVPVPLWSWPLYLIPFAIGYVAYRASITSAIDWGDRIRASIDLHRLKLYEHLGIRHPTSFSDERELAVRVNKALLFGRPRLGDELWRHAQADSRAEADSEAEPIGDGGTIAVVMKWLTKGAR
jgi:hypothetical protein